MMLNRTKGVSILQHLISLAILFFFLSMGIHLIGIDTLSLTSDECFSIYHAQMSPSLIYLNLSTGNNPPLHEWILHYWMLWFGDSAFAVRFLSLIFSSLTTALIFVLGTQIASGDGGIKETTGNPRIGVIAAILFLASNYSTFLAHEARTYNLTLFLGVLSTILFVTAIRSGKMKHFLVYGLIGGLLCLSHFFGIWILLAHGSFWLWINKKNLRGIRRMGGAVLGFGIAFGWYIPNLWYRFVDSASQGTWVNPAPWDAPYLTLWKYLNTPIATISAISLLIYLPFYLFKNKANPSIRYQILVFWIFALPFFGQWLLSLDHPFSIPMFTERYAGITLPFLCLSLSVSLLALPLSLGKHISAIKTITIIGLMMLGRSFTPPNQASAKEALQTAKVSLAANWGKTPIILEPYHSAFQVLYYADHNRFKQYQFKQHQPHLIYDHLASQLSHSNIWILKTAKSLDSLGLSRKSHLTYLRFGTVKSAHTIQIEQQLEKLTSTGGSIKSSTIQIPKRLWGTTEISSEAEFWLIERK
ncbi:MAG: glycosyltransferase family 39 protein [Bacteroidetes bacterium]|nr:glycosyltransferase family 39 protein [Bacteroidota bacterium]MDA1225107.1 glycosyltransferase family 39 protein [Bacteroidota bacterium]